jgi:uncharacterized SAM-binding protein YcdF (DUF218 family)
MEYLISKVAPVFVYPLGLAIALALWAAAIGCRRPASARRLNLILAFGLWLSSTAPIAWFLAGTLERQYPPLQSDVPVGGDAIVVLGGIVSAERAPGAGPNYQAASDRLWYAARLYREGKARVVICSGGSDTEGGRLPPEAVVMASALEELGVPSGAIVIETESRTTLTNVRNLEPILKRLGAGRVILVTSALHMPRAMTLMRQQGVETIAAPTDFNSLGPSRGALDWLPSAEALILTTAALKEHIGLIYVRVRGAVIDPEGQVQMGYSS